MQDKFSNAAQPGTEADALHKQSEKLWTKLRFDGYRDGAVQDNSEVYGLLDKALAIDPNHVASLHLKGCVLYWDGRKAEAEDCLKAALVIDPAMRPASLILSGILYHSGRYAEAVTCLEAAAKAAPQSAKGWNDLGDMLLATGRYAEAVTAFAEVLGGENLGTPGDSPYERTVAQYLTGEARVKLGDIPKAGLAFAEAAALAEAAHDDTMYQVAQAQVRHFAAPKPGPYIRSGEYK